MILDGLEYGICIELGSVSSDVNKGSSLKAKARTKDQNFKAKDRTKDLND